MNDIYLVELHHTFNDEKEFLGIFTYDKAIQMAESVVNSLYNLQQIYCDREGLGEPEKPFRNESDTFFCGTIHINVTKIKLNDSKLVEDKIEQFKRETKND